MGYCLRKWPPMTPKPGSASAVAVGCECDIRENDARREWSGETVFWQRQGCPIHWPHPAPGEVAGVCPNEPEGETE